MYGAIGFPANHNRSRWRTESHLNLNSFRPLWFLLSPSRQTSMETSKRCWRSKQIQTSVGNAALASWVAESEPCGES